MGLAMVSPALLLFLLFSVYPLISGVILSFYDASVFGKAFIGWGNYREIFTNQRFWKGFVNVLKFTAISIPVEIFLPLFIGALAVRLSKALQFTVRFAFYIPNLAAGVVIASVWKWIFHPSRGILNWLLGIDIAWLAENPYAFYAITIMMLSSVMGMTVIIYMAAFSAINKDLYEAAKLDGCGEWGELIHVTIPQILPIMMFIAITRTIGVLQIWQLPFLMTGGGPNYGTTTITLQIYQNGFQFQRWGYASALGVVLLVLTLIFSVTQKYLFRGRE